MIQDTLIADNSNIKRWLLNGTIKNVTDFLGQVKAELLKIEWPSFDDFVGSTIITMILVVFFTIFIFGVDQAIKVLAKYIFTYSL